MPAKGEGYIWIPGEDPPPIEAHSKQKHKVLTSYITSYVQILASNPRRGNLSLTIVDGFAGGGVYTDEETGDEYPGSPFKIPDAVREGEARVNLTRDQQGIRNRLHVDAEFHFVEANPVHFEYLQQAVRQRGYQHVVSGETTFHQSTFEACFEDIVQHIEKSSKRRRCIFILDQYGYTEVPLPKIRELLIRLPNAEVILTFATDALINYLTEQRLQQHLKTFEKVGITDIDIGELIRAGHASGDFRKYVQSSLITSLKTASSANFFTPFFITCKKSNRAYWLIHFSMHPRARDAMLTEHWNHDNTFAHYGGAGLNMLGYSPKADFSLGPQTSFPFEFDDSAKDRAKKSLLEDIPRRLHEMSVCTTVRDFLTSVANETPATNQQILDVLRSLNGEKSIQVLTPEGSLKRRGAEVKKNDILDRQTQTYFDFRNTKN